MYGLTHSLKETRFYQEAFEEGFKEGVRQGKKQVWERLFSYGYSLEDIAQLLEVSVDEVQEIVQSANESEM